MAEDHKTRIVVEGDVSDAENKLKNLGSAVDKLPLGLGNVVKGLHWVREGVSKVMAAFGLIGLAIQGVKALVDGFNWLKGKLEEAQAFAHKLAFELNMATAAASTNRLIGFHEKLSKLLKEELDTMAKQREIRDIEQQGADDYESARREADRAQQIADAATPEEAQALRDKFADEDEQLALAAKKKARKQQIRDLEDEESAYASKARGLRDNNNQIDEQIKREEENYKRTKGTSVDGEPIKKRIESLKQRKAANEAEIQQYDAEAKHRRDKITALEGIKDYEGKSAGQINREKARRDREDKAFEEEQKRARESDDAAREFVESNRKEREAEDERKRGSVQSALDSAYSFGQVSGNRLTAMGLGSGVRGTDSLATDMHKMLDLMREQIKATKDNKPTDGSSTATFSE